MACPGFTPEAYATSLVALIDCRVEDLGRDGYLALAASGSPVMMALGGLLAILIGLTGYRLLLGDPLEIRDGVLLVVRIGIVLALATQWPAYQTVVYNVVVRGPGELSASLANSIGGAPAEMVGRVQGVYDTLEALAHPARPQAIAPLTASADNPAAASAPPNIQLPTTLTIEEQHRVSSAALALLISSLAGAVSVRLVAALLLALGPLFIACLLFRGLSGLFEGWVRGLAGAFLGSIAVTVVLATELAILEPQVIALVQALQTESVPTGAAGEILATVLLFGIVMLALLIAAVRVGAGFRLPAMAGLVQREWGPRLGMQRVDRSSLTSPEPRLATAIAAPSRASQIVDALKIVELRESGHAPAPARRAALSSQAERNETTRIPLGQSHKRTLARRSAAANRRDQGS